MIYITKQYYYMINIIIQYNLISIQTLMSFKAQFIKSTRSIEIYVRLIKNQEF